MFKEYYDKLLLQLAVDYNCSSSEFRTEGNVITIPAWVETEAKKIGE